MIQFLMDMDCLRGLGLHYGGETVGATVIPMSTGNTKKQITMMHDLGTAIACTPLIYYI